MTFIQTFNDNKFDFCDLHGNRFEPDEIAEVLYRVNRFAGHTKWPYSVAQHSVLVARKCKHPLVGLLHDVPEVWLGDVTTPLGKNEEFQALEESIWYWIAFLHDFPPHLIDEVKEADRRALATEKRDLFDHQFTWPDMLPPYKRRIQVWDRNYARDMWLQYYWEYK